MITITIIQSMAPSGATVWELAPRLISLGGRDANHVDAIRFSDIPEAWSGMTIRATFVPAQPGADSIAIVLDDTYQILVPQAVTQYPNGGALTLDAADGTYHAYTRPADYRVYPHPDAGGVSPAPPADEWSQLVSQVQGYASTAQAAKAAALTASDTAAGQAAAAAQSQTAAAGSASDAQMWAESSSEWSEQSAAVGGGTTTVWHKSAKAHAADAAASAAASASSAAQISTCIANIATNTADIAQLRQAKAGALTVTEAGNPLTICPDAAAGALAAVKVSGLTVQAGSGTPTPANVRAISGVAASAAVGGTAYSVSTGALYTGDYADLVSGAVHRACRLVTFDGSENWQAGDGTNGAYFYLDGIFSPMIAVGFSKTVPGTNFWCSALSWGTGSNWTSGANTCWINEAGANFRVIWEPGKTLADWKALLASAPVQVLYQMAVPTDAAGTGSAIPVAGDTVVTAENTVAVTYNKSLISAIGQLQTAIAALGTT